MGDRNMRERIKRQKVKERNKKRDRYREKHIDIFVDQNLNI